MTLILIADGDQSFRETAARVLGGRDRRIEIAQDPKQLMRVVSQHPFDLVLLDIDMMYGGDLDMIDFVKQSYPDTEIIVVTDAERIDRGVDAMRRGAYLYALRSFKPDDLVTIVDGALKKRKQTSNLRRLERNAIEQTVGSSPAMRRVLELATKVAVTDSTVLLTGESGTGKDVIANLIHRMSPRSQRPFVVVNCAALPETLLESELFGHVKGSFTGADTDKVGLFEEAHQGTIFLDEIGDMAMATQAKLLRVLQNGEVRRVGDTSPRYVDVRLLAATNQDLAALIAERKFRQDLYFRLNVVQIKLPPLRERKDSLPTLIRHFLTKYNNRLGRNVTTIDEYALRLLAHYDYPGNIRELENIIEHAIIMAEDDIIRPRDLPENVYRPPGRLALPPSGTYEQSIDEFVTIEEMERRLIRDTITRTGGNQTLAAKKLGISRSTLWRKLKQLGIEPVETEQVEDIE
ncbi:MAG: sigma-54-dependent Fis family transcriptional regulator [Candidatus Hydrogenedentes bacterium]|nr:sigma-54-dependent Fis family transcriptional regulator [Candidatus Hydrogenedentota bacterium]